MARLLRHLRVHTPCGCQRRLCLTSSVPCRALPSCWTMLRLVAAESRPGLFYRTARLLEAGIQPVYGVCLIMKVHHVPVYSECTLTP